MDQEERKFVMCRDCMVPRTCIWQGQRRLGCPINPEEYVSIIDHRHWHPQTGCKQGVSYHEVEQEKAKHESGRFTVHFDSIGRVMEEKIDQATEQAIDRIAKEILAEGFPLAHPGPSKTTFLCKSCLYPVKVASDMLGDELRFKCFVCHKENHYDLTD